MRLIACSVLLALTHLSSGGETIIAQSTFDAGDEGWTYPASVAWNAGTGNPGGALVGAISEPNNITAIAEAPAAFLGDWSALDDGVGELRFDFSLISMGQGAILDIYPIAPRIIGPGGNAVWRGPTPTTTTPWTTYIARIHPDDWELTAGNWAALLADVQTLRFPLEIVSNVGPAEDWQALDNVRLVLLPSDCSADFNADDTLDFFDVQLFLQAFASADESADFNDDTMFDFFDVQLFLQAFSGGCG